MATINTDLPEITCRKCACKNPWVYLGPVYDYAKDTASCVCFDCADKLGWLDRSGNLKPGYSA